MRSALCGNACMVAGPLPGEMSKTVTISKALKFNTSSLHQPISEFTPAKPKIAAAIGGVIGASMQTQVLAGGICSRKFSSDEAPHRIAYTHQ